MDEQEAPFTSWDDPWAKAAYACQLTLRLESLLETRRERRYSRAERRERRNALARQKYSTNSEYRNRIKERTRNYHRERARERNGTSDKPYCEEK